MGIQLSLNSSCQLAPPSSCGAAIFYGSSNLARRFMRVCKWWAEPVPLQVSSKTWAWAAKPLWLLCGGHSRAVPELTLSCHTRGDCLKMVAEIRPWWAFQKNESYRTSNESGTTRQQKLWPPHCCHGGRTLPLSSLKTLPLHETTHYCTCLQNSRGG